MALHQRKGYPRRATLPDQVVVDPRWSSGEPPSPIVIGTTDDEANEPIQSPEEELIEHGESVARFVRIVHGQVGMYPRGSVVPAVAFPHLDNLLKLGAVEYDHVATGEYITGDAQNLASIAGLGRAQIQTIPNAPWVTAAAHNLLGATYQSIMGTQREWTPLPEPSVVITQIEPVEQRVETISAVDATSSTEHSLDSPF